MDVLKGYHRNYVLSVILVLSLSRDFSAYTYDYYDNGYLSDLSTDWGMLGGRTHQPKCVKIPESLKLCKNIGYTDMRLPNLLDHETIAEVVDQTRVWVPLLNIYCHPDTQLFLCSLYSPVCLEPSIYPCRSLCEGVKRGCEERIKNYGYPWPEILKCDKFPDTMCIEQVNFDDSHGRTSSEAANVCLACKQPLTFESLLDSYCWANFVVKARLQKTVHDQLGDKRIIFKGKRAFYKPKANILSKQESDAMEPVITDGASCECEALDKPGQRLLIMGAVRGDRFEVTYVSAWSKNREFKRAIHAIRKGHDCKGVIDKIAGITDANNGGLSTDTPVPSVDKEIETGVTLPTDTGVKIDGNETERNKKKKNRRKNKGRGKKGKGGKRGKKNRKDKKRKGNKKGKGNKKNKDKKGTTDPMANIAGIGCIPCKQPLAFGNLVEKYCDANFVVKARVRKLKMDDNGDKRLMIRLKKKSSLYRQVDMSKRDIRKLQPVISGGANCDCLSAHPGKGNLFIMGKKVGNRFVISFLSEYVKDSEFKRFTRAVRKGYDCSSSSQPPGGVNRV